jgi:predicted ATPase
VTAAELAAVLPPTNLPEPVSELIGRDGELREIVSLAATHRLVTLTGPGGIGKTRLALAVARQLAPQFADGVWVAELAPLADPNLVAATLAAAVGLDLGGGEVSAPRVAQALADRRLLLVLDTCEHVIAAAAALTEAVLRAGSAVRIIATSREPLRAEAEQVYPVPPLAVPAMAGDDPCQYGAVRLFVERARAAEPHFAPDQHLAMITPICRRLDGIPLAIELAAARAAALGVEELSARLDDRFRLLTGGRRTALPRHQTLRATLDWSYELLTAPERMVLRRLAIFASTFSLEAAGAVAASSGVAPSEVVDGVSSLVEKSLVAAEVEGAIARYLLLDTTRAYALQKLAEGGECKLLARRHAEYYRDLFERAESEWETRPTTDWLGDYGRQIDNLRAALDWAFSPAGNASIGLALTTAAVPLWVHLSLMEECRSRVERALAAIAREVDRDLRCEMKLHAALGASQIHTGAVTVPQMGAAWTKVLEIAEKLDDAEYQLRSLLGLWFFETVSGRHRVALALAQSFYSLAAKQSDPNDPLIGERMIGVSQYYLGDHSSARHRLEHMLAHYAPVAQKSHIIRFQSDQQVTARVVLARILWLQGFADQSMRAVESSIADARTASHTNSLCYALSQAACPIALLVGDLTASEHYIKMLLDQSTRAALALWQAWGRSYQGVLGIEQGDFATGLRCCAPALTNSPKLGSLPCGKSRS